MKHTYSASGKLMLFGEYLVLRGAKCLAIPLNVGQNLEVLPYEQEGILWQSFEKDTLWLEILFSSELEIVKSNDQEKAEIVQNLLRLIQSENPRSPINHVYFKFTIQFNREFGFGTSSTLISLLSQWSGVNPYFLLEKSFNGSGYDIAAATAKKPFIYTIKDTQINSFDLSKTITDQLLFVYLGEKQTSATEISKFSSIQTNDTQIEQMNQLVKKVSACKDIEEWEKLMIASESFMSSILAIPPIKEKLFNDYPYAIKSLGAWGGDFVMATCRNVVEAKAYFSQKGKHVLVTFNDIIAND